MKVVLLRIGIDTGSGGIHGPLFADGTFEYVPIPDRHTSDERTYGNIVGTHGRPLIDYFPASMRNRMTDQPMHVDPEFDTFTYGDPTTPKAGLRQLKPGDLLVFYCGLQGWDFTSDPALYLMGFFEVERAGRADQFTKTELDRLFSRNFHVRHPRVFERQKESLVLVKGTGNSRLLHKAIRLSADGKDRAGKPLKILSPAMCGVFGNFGGHVSIQRSPPRWVEPEFTRKAAEFVRSLGQNCHQAGILPGPSCGTKAFSYVIVHDTGFAPNPFWGFCTLANCKPQIRRRARRGDWVFGMGSPRNVGNGKLVYAMRVDEVLTFEQYDTDPRFASKRPILSGSPHEQCGDNIYFTNETGKWRQRPSFHKPKDMKRDLGGKNVLISSHFFYFGADGKAVPPEFERLIHKGRAHTCHFPPNLVERFLEWLHDHYKPERQGEPSNKPVAVRESSKLLCMTCSPQNRASFCAESVGREDETN